jgi:DNA-binding transcriptional regulator LsrR (DeoR family)
MQDRRSPGGKTTNDELFHLAEVAWLYYGQELTQEQIAQETGLSRPTISRMLREARERGVVEIRVHYPFQTASDLEAEVLTRLGLTDCRVLAAGATAEGGNGGDIPSRVGALAARYLQKQIPDGSTIGVGWGSMVYNVVHGEYLAHKRGSVVAQIQGSVGGASPDIDGAGLAATLGRELGGRVHTLSAPMVVADVSVRAGLMRDQHIRHTLELGKRADALVVGVGAVSPQSGLYRAGYLNDADLEFIRGQGAVGDVCGSYFARDGAPCPLELNDRMIALDADAMRRAPLRVGISCGVEKALPNIGAARSGLINVLITDEDAATAMLRLIDAEPAETRGSERQ